MSNRSVSYLFVHCHSKIDMNEGRTFPVRLSVSRTSSPSRIDARRGRRGSV